MKIKILPIWKQRLFVIPMFFIPLLLSGCWSAEEINNIAIMNAIGVDFNHAGEYEVTSVIVKPAVLFSQPLVGGTGGSQQNPFLIEKATGKSLLEAVGKLSKTISAKIYFGHVDVVVFGEEIARRKMEPTLDFFHRENQFRPNIQLLVSKGKAADVINTAPQFNITFGREILGLKENNRYVATKMVEDISQFMKRFSSDTSDPVTGVVTTADKLGITAKAENLDSQNKQQKKIQVISLDGTAVFKGSNLKGFLSETDTRGLLSILGKLKNEIFVINCGGNDKGNVSVVINKTNSQIIPHINGKNTNMTIKANVEANIREVTCSNLNVTSDQIDHLNRQLEDSIKNEGTKVLEKVQKQWQADIFGFGEAIYRTYPHEWDQMAPNWRKGGLKDLDVELKVTANISRFGLYKDPSKANESR
ncbi:Ger(x)C family spore germination protein [Bacillus sp. 1NLA3E]|uniref:Ger(x)C family spore germination protein n=1 Tax=Bacillus sp. 1NLA3E TaxID=666686 RepID=UPI000247E554|nr:Ger(x)C family spore germination protein [Bacillus sp. 1NLA3E]AGK52593.1 Ger(x)C family germination protein [Bacillus sp. 1NLA3E]